MLQLPVYMDYHATTPCDQRVMEAMAPYFNQHFGNASSKGHAFGWYAEEGVQIAREQLAHLVNASPEEIIFTSGATESVNLAIKGVYEMLSGKGKHIITLSTEHRAVLDACHHVEKMGADISYLPVLPDGLVDLESLKSAIRTDTILIALMYANNETGVLQPVKTISEIARASGIYFFSDATQALGKVSVDVVQDGIDLLACSAHKLYGPKGVGALFVRRKNPRVRLSPQMDGGGQERGFRSGTLNVPGIVGFGKAAFLAASEMKNYIPVVAGLRNRLEKGLLTIEGAMLNGHRLLRLPTVTNISFAGEGGHNLPAVLGKELAISSGSACHSANPEPSHVLKAMGLSDDLSFRAARFSLGRYNTAEEVKFVIDKVRRTLKSAGNEIEKLKN